MFFAGVNAAAAVLMIASAVKSGNWVAAWFAFTTAYFFWCYASEKRKKGGQ